MFKTCPDPIDVQDLQFKLHCRLKVFNNKEADTFPKSNSLISCASRYGLLFVGSNTSSLQVIQIKCVENYTPKDKDISTYPRRNVVLPSPPQHVCVNCDSTILAVVTERDSCPIVTFYDVLSFVRQNISIIKEVRLSSTPGTYVREIGWNPALPAIFTACKSDGTLGVYEIKGISININELPAASEATCFCWSPKGKQIAVGSRNSRITQYKPDLKAVKVINQPPLEGVHSLISLQWVSNYQFIGIYQSAEQEGTAKLVVVDAPKTGEAVYTNYEDVCYSSSARLPQFYMILQQHWNILMVASSNSTELGVLGSTGEIWTQWIISDSARAELPLSSDRQETLPVGLALDISSTTPLPWNESTIPPCPYLLILSHHGILCLFDIVNLKQGVPSICTPPDSISDLSGLQQFFTPMTSANVPQQSSEPSAALPTISQTSQVSQAPIFGAKILSQPQPTYAAAPTTLFGTKPVENKPLFGGQTTLTPIKPQLTIPQPLFGGQTFITPINKPQTTTVPAVNTGEKYSTIFSALSTPAATPLPTESKPIVIATQNLAKPTAPVEQPVAVHQNVSAPVKPAEPPKPAVNLKIKEETDILLAQMLRDESISLESELKALLHQGKLINIDIGSEQEKIELVTRIESLQEFIKEIVDISIGENAEVHYLKQNLIQSWAWYEEALSRYNASKDETVSLLLRSQPLDSATEKKQTDISKLMYYIESQISQASKALDEQWDNFQDYAKKIHRTKMPTMEAIFQAMVRQNVILQKQSYILRDISGRLKSKGQTANIPSLLFSIENTKDLEESLNRLKIDNPQDMYQIQYQRVLNRMKNFSETKTNRLRNLLKTRDVPHVTATKPQLSSSLMLQSPESKSKRLLSNLATPGMTMSPLPVPTPKALTFAHSTPIRETKTNVKPSEAPMGTTQVLALRKTEKSNLAATTNSFIPLAKSASVFSNLPQDGVTQAPLPTHASAFVPTQVNFASGSKFSFTSGAASAPVATKTAPASTGGITFTAGMATLTPQAIPAVTKTVGGITFTGGIAKFSAPTTPKTPDTPTTAKASAPQFNFGGSLTIAPVTSNKKDLPASNVTTFGVPATTKPSFSFSGTSLFGTTASSSSPQANVTTTASGFFSNLTQVNKPMSGNVPSSEPSGFGVTANTLKLSAFSAVPTNSSSISLPTMTASKTEAVPKTQPSTFAIKIATDAGIIKSVPASNAVATATVTATVAVTSAAKPLVTATVAPTVPTPLNIPLFGATTGKSLSVFETTTTPTATVEVTSASASSTPLLMKQSLAFGISSTTSSVSVVSSSSLGFSVTTSALTKPISSVTPSIPSQSLFFGAVPSVSSTGPSLSMFSSNTSVAASKPSTGFGVAVTTPQPSIFAGAVPSSAQPPSLGIQSSPQDVSTSSGVSQTPATVAQTSVIDATKAATTTVSQSFFGSTKVSSTQPSIFGTAEATAAQPAMFGGAQKATSGVSVTTQSTTSIFGGGQISSTSQQSIFGSAVITAQPSIFGGAQSTSNESSTTTQPTSIFNTGNATTSTPASVFGTAVSTTKSSIFDLSVPKSTATSIFGSAATTTAQSSIFGTLSTSSTTKSSIFGATPAPVSNQTSLFSANPATSTQQGSIFGGAASTTATPLFGSTPPAQASIFSGGKTAESLAGKPSIFGAPQASTTQNSLFGGSTVASTQSSIFGTASTTATSPFAPAFGSSSLAAPFGQTSPSFGAPKTTTGSTFNSGFGSPTGFGGTPATTASIFGQPTSFGGTAAPAFGTPTTATNVFGANTSANVFGAPASAAPSSFSFAGTAGSASTGAFGFGGLSVGSPPTTSSAFGGGAAFGQTAAANPFSRSTEQKSPFGGGSIFGGAASSAGSVFASNTGSTFSSNTQGGFGASSFGSPAAFSQQSTFGQNTFGNSSFGSPQPGPFSSGSGGVSQTGFGSPSSFSKPTGFGSSPVFGGSPQPAFGAAPSFGGAPAFGAAPAFGSPNKIFGGNSPTGAFGSASTASAGFGNLATQNTVGFGNLAQQAANSNSAPFSGSSSFSTWR